MKSIWTCICQAKMPHALNEIEVNIMVLFHAEVSLWCWGKEGIDPTVSLIHIGDDPANDEERLCDCEIGDCLVIGKESE